VVVLAGALGCAARTVGGESDRDAAVGGGTTPVGGLTGSGGTGGSTHGSSTPGGGTAGGGMPGGGIAATSGASGTGNYPPDSCFEQYTSCSAGVTIPFVTLPDGLLSVCRDDNCFDQSVSGGQIAESGGAEQVRLYEGDLLASWHAGRFGLSAPVGCSGNVGNSVLFKSPAGSVIVLFSGQIPMVTSYGKCNNSATGSVELTEPVDIAALVLAHEAGGQSGSEGGAAGAAGSGAGGQPEGGAAGTF